MTIEQKQYKELKRMKHLHGIMPRSEFLKKVLTLLAMEEQMRTELVEHEARESA